MHQDIPKCRPVARGCKWVQCTHKQIYLHPLGIHRISKTDMLISPQKTCDTLPHLCLTSVQLLWLETSHLKNIYYISCMCIIEQSIQKGMHVYVCICTPTVSCCSSCVHGLGMSLLMSQNLVFCVSFLSRV